MCLIAFDMSSRRLSSRFGKGFPLGLRILPIAWTGASFLNRSLQAIQRFNTASASGRRLQTAACNASCKHRLRPVAQVAQRNRHATPVLLALHSEQKTERAVTAVL